jgi:competence transcription factor ComK
MIPEAINGKSDISVISALAATKEATYHTHAISHKAPIITNLIITDSFISLQIALHRY